MLPARSHEAGANRVNRSLSTVPRQSLRHSALHRIRQAIVTGELCAGSKLNEIKLSQQLGISRSLYQVYVQMLRRCLGARTTVEAVAVWVQEVRP